MTAIKIAVDMPLHPKFDVERFKLRVQEYAKMLCLIMSDTSTVEQKQTKERTEALSFIQSLAVPGGENVPDNTNPIDCLIDAKYGK